MALLIDERMLYCTGELLLGGGPLEVTCRLTVEWLRGIPEPTWYGYLIPLAGEMRVMPGRYRLRLAEHQLQVLVRRPVTAAEQVCFPFWGLGTPPPVPAAEVSPGPTGDEQQ